jgi:hypothetical protein
LVCLRVRWGGGGGGKTEGEGEIGGVGGAEGGVGKGDGGLYGYITGLDYDYYHKLELGLLEQVWTKITRDGNSTDDVCPFHTPFPLHPPLSYSLSL